MDGQAVLACSILTVECDGKQVGLQDEATGRLDPLQQAFVDHTAYQCGFCTPGIIMTAKAFLDAQPHPAKEEITDARICLGAVAAGPVRARAAVRKALTAK